MALKFLSPLHRATRQISLYLEEKIRDLDVRPDDGHVLSFLRSYSPCPIYEVRRVMGHKPSTMTSLIDRLEAKGHLRREQDPDDGRVYLLQLTPDGRAVADRIQQIIEELEERIREGIDPAALEGFDAVMASIGRATSVAVRPPEGSSG